MKGVIFDDKSVRSFDENGYMHVAMTNISKACVNPYLGAEIPHAKELGLDPNRIYYALRAPEELEKAASSFNGLPLLLDHHPFDAMNQEKQYVVGSVGTDATFDGTYLKNSLTITDAKAIEMVESGKMKEISCAYGFEPDWTAGEYQEGNDKIHYDFVMRNIHGNHVALVAEGRAGHDVKVADGLSAKVKKEQRMDKRKVFDSILAEILPEIEEEKKNEILEKLVAVENEPGDGEPAPKPEDEAPEGEAGNPAGDEEPEGEEPKTGDEDPESKEPENPIKDDELEERLKDPAFKEAFEIGVKYGEERQKANPEGLAKEHEREGEEKALAGDTLEKVRKQMYDAAMKDFKELNEAARKVRPIVGEIKDVNAFDSAEKIYGFALKKAGKDIRKYAPVAYGAMVDMLLDQKRANDACTVKNDDALDKLAERVRKIKRA